MTVAGEAPRVDSTLETVDSTVIDRRYREILRIKSDARAGDPYPAEAKDRGARSSGANGWQTKNHGADPRQGLVRHSYSRPDRLCRPLALARLEMDSVTPGPPRSAPAGDAGDGLHRR